MRREMALLLLIAVAAGMCGCITQTQSDYATEQIHAYTNESDITITSASSTYDDRYSDAKFNYTFVAGNKTGYLSFEEDNVFYTTRRVIDMKWPVRE